MSRHYIDTPTVAGQAASLLTYLSRVLCVGEVKRDAGGFTDHSTEARTEGGTAFDLLAATTDDVYVGYDSKFGQVRVDLATAGADVTLVAEYWDGDSWNALTITDDETSDLTVDGEIIWTIPGDWAKNVVDSGPSMYHIRLSTSTTPSVTPTANFLVVNWTLYDNAAGTNVKVYKSIGEDGISNFLLWVADAGTEYTDAKNSACRLYETWDSDAHTGTLPCPTTTLLAAGMGIRKSALADATARTVRAVVSRDRINMLTYSGDVAGRCATMYAGGITPTLASDAYRGVVMGQAATLTTDNAQASLVQCTNPGVVSVPTNIKHIQRIYQGTGVAVPISSVPVVGSLSAGNFGIMSPNGPDSAIYAFPMRVHEGLNSTAIRGLLEDILVVPHLTGSGFVDGDTFTLSGNTYILCLVIAMGSSAHAGQFVALRTNLP